ncbi:MAG: hypothetical protein ABIK30_13410 [bacterium]
MAKHRSFTLEKFIKSTNSDLLKQYFIKKEVTVPQDVVFDGGESFDNFWKSLPDDKKAYCEAELQCINDVADKSRNYLEKAIKDFNITVIRDGNNPDSPETTSMRVFLHGEEAFDVAYDQYLCVIYSEKLSHHKFKKGNPDFNEERFKAFESQVVAFLNENSKGNHYDVRKYEEDGKYFILLARGDFVRTHLVFNEGKVRIQSYRPANEDVLIFDKKNSVLSIKLSRRSNDEEKKYLEVFGKEIMGVDTIDGDTVDSGLVSLESIKNGTFKYEGNDAIESVKLTEVKVRQGGKRGGAWLNVGSVDVTDFFNRYKLQSDYTNFVAIKLKFFMKREGNKIKPVQIEIRPPMTAKIPEKEGKVAIEEYLYDNGVLQFK